VARVSRLDVFTVRLPFRFSFGHALAERRSSTNIAVRLRLDDGTVGFGEGVPRAYVTGETPDTAIAAIESFHAPVLLGRALADAGDVADAAAELPPVHPAARCAVELALLDAGGRHLGLPVSHWLGGASAPVVEYDAVLPFVGRGLVTPIAVALLALGPRKVKVKVGRDLEAEARALITLRRVLGPGADLRVDANCAWGEAEALRALEKLRPAGISAVEQPLPPGDLEAHARLTAAIPETLVADESLLGIEDAEALAAGRACDAFNIRVSKCGGLLPSLEIARVAARNGLACVVGAQVGESGILSAAGRHLAAAIRPRYLEGSPGRLLLREELVAEAVAPGRRGRARTPHGSGLGVTVREDVLHRLGTLHRSLSPELAAAW